MRFYLILAMAILTSPILSQRELTALRIDQSIEVNGSLDEAVWTRAEVASGFTNWQPLAGETPSSPTEVKILYDDKAIYIGAYLIAGSREDIKTELSTRDNIGNTDWFGFVLDTYGNGTDASEFIVSATGVQFDAKMTSNVEDTNWDEVWFSDVKITDKGWFVEMKIPYSAIRFPKKDVQNWKFNFMRRMAATAEKCSYEFIDPQVSGFINQSALLKGVSNIKSPIRLSLSPYITTYAQRSSNGGENPTTSTAYSYNGGLDLKYGINEAFTLDMTLIPDFGQTQSDDLVLNLSPFEVRYDENRAFFTEGLELFNKAGIFYTRRVGGVPLHYHQVSHHLHESDEIVDNPNTTQLYNATKISGRTNSGLGVGIFNAISGNTTAEIRNSEDGSTREFTTSPLTNYSVVVFDQNLKNNSSISLINTNVWRQGSEFYDANVTGVEFDLRNNAQSYSLTGDGSFSQILNSGADNVNGAKYNLNFNKISGNFQFSISGTGTSKQYNNNDLGFNTETNVKGYYFGGNYSFNKGWKSLAQGSAWFNYFINTTYEKNLLQSHHFNSGFWTRTKSQWNINMWTNYRPEFKDYFEPRVDGRFLVRPAFYNMGWFISSDRRKKMALSGRLFGSKRFGDDGHYYDFYLQPRYRFSNNFWVFLGVDGSFNNNSRGFVSFQNSDPVIGLRDQVTMNNVLGVNYTFSATMAVNLRVRHYWSKVQYDGFYGLSEEGELIDSDYNSFNDFTFNLMNLDLNYTWRFAPGSDLIFNWKSNVAGGEFSDLINYRERSYFDGLQSLNDLPSVNSVSLRLVYFLNAAQFL